MVDQNGFEDLCAHLASLKLIPSPPGSTFLLLFSQDSALYCRELLQRLWDQRAQICVSTELISFARPAILLPVSVQPPLFGAPFPLISVGRHISAHLGLDFAFCDIAYPASFQKPGLLPSLEASPSLGIGQRQMLMARRSLFTFFLGTRIDSSNCPCKGGL